MVSKMTFNKFSLGYSISSFLITFGTITLFDSIATKLFLMGAHSLDVILFLGFVTQFSFILAIVAPLLGAFSDKRKQGSRRRPFLMFGIVGMAFVTVLFYFAPIGFGINDIFLNIVFFATLYGIYLFSSLTFNISFISLYPEMFKNLDLRSTVIALLLGFSALASIIIVLLEVFMALENIYFGIIFGFLIILGGIILFRRGFDEQYSQLSEKPKSDEQSSYKILSSNNKLFKWFLIAFFFITISEMLITNALNYNQLTNVVSIPPSLLEILTFFLDIAPSVFVIVFVLYWRKLTLSIGIKKLLKILIIALLSFSIAILFLSDFISGIIFTSLIEVGLSGLNFAKLLLLAIIIDHFFLNTGRRREATYFGLNYTFNLISGFIGTFLASLITTFSVLFINPFEAIQTYYFFSKIGLILFALIFFGLSFISIRKIPLDRGKYDEIEKEITEINT